MADLEIEASVSATISKDWITLIKTITPSWEEVITSACEEDEVRYSMEDDRHVLLGTFEAIRNVRNRLNKEAKRLDGLRDSSKDLGTSSLADDERVVNGLTDRDKILPNTDSMQKEGDALKGKRARILKTPLDQQTRSDKDGSANDRGHNQQQHSASNHEDDVPSGLIKPMAGSNDDDDDDDDGDGDDGENEQQLARPKDDNRQRQPNLSDDDDNQNRQQQQLPGSGNDHDYDKKQLSRSASSDREVHGEQTPTFLPNRDDGRREQQQMKERKQQSQLVPISNDDDGCNRQHPQPMTALYDDDGYSGRLQFQDQPRYQHHRNFEDANQSRLPNDIPHGRPPHDIPQSHAAADYFSGEMSQIIDKQPVGRGFNPLEGQSFTSAVFDPSATQTEKSFQQRPTVNTSNLHQTEGKGQTISLDKHESKSIYPCLRSLESPSEIATLGEEQIRFQGHPAVGYTDSQEQISYSYPSATSQMENSGFQQEMTYLFVNDPSKCQGHTDSQWPMLGAIVPCATMNQRETVHQELDTKVINSQGHVPNTTPQTSFQVYVHQPVLYQPFLLTHQRACYMSFRSNRSHHVLNVFVREANIAEQRTHFIVTSANQALSEYGSVSKTVLNVAGQTVVDECRQKLGPWLHTGAVVDTGAGNLHPPVEKILHAIIPTIDQFKHDQGLCFNHLCSIFYQCLMFPLTQSKSSITIPSIGSEVVGLPMVVQAFADAMKKFDQHVWHTLCASSLGAAAPVLNCMDIHFINNDPNKVQQMIDVLKTALPI